MKVLVTGAAGFVGAEVVRALLAAGDDVYAAVRASSKRDRLAALAPVRVVEADFSTPAGRRVLADLNVDVCVHTAWCATPGVYLSSFENIEMQSGTLHLARVLFEGSCRRFVGVGTCFEYDTSAGYLSESAELAPAHLYSAAKAGTYFGLREIGRLMGRSVAWSRLFYLYGPNEYPQRLVASIARALVRGEEARCSPGAQVRDFLHVADAGAAIAAVAKSDLVDAVNIASGEPVTVAEVVRRLGAIAGRPELLRMGALPYGERDPMFVCANVRRLLAETQWRRRWTLDDGLADAVAYWRANESSTER